MYDSLGHKKGPSDNAEDTCLLLRSPMVLVPAGHLGFRKGLPAF